MNKGGGLIIGAEGGLGDGKGKAGARIALMAHNRGLEVVSNDFAQMPRSGGGYKPCKILHVDDIIDERGKPKLILENVHYWIQEAWMELDARIGIMGGGATKRVLGLAYQIVRFRHLGNTMFWDSPRFGDVDVRVRVPTAHRVWCLKGDRFVEIWLDRVRGRVAVKTAPLDIMRELAPLYHSESKDAASHLF